MFSHLVLTGLLFSNIGFHGATLSFYGEHVHESGTYETRLKHLAGIGAQSVSFVVFWSLNDINDDDVRPSEEDLALEPVLVQSIRQARALGLDVMLMPVIRLQVMRARMAGKLSPKRPVGFGNRTKSSLCITQPSLRGEGRLFSVGSELSS